MSQFPVAASDEHPGKSSGMASCDTLQKLPVEPIPRAPAFLGSNNPGHFPFLKLAVETRLEIYNYLLIAFPSGPRSTIPKEGASHGVSLDFYTIRDADQEKKIACKRISSSRKACTSIGITPQILCTCKTIHQEAAPILYEMNLFQFRIWDAFVSSEPNTIRQGRLEYVRWGLYQDPAELWGEKASGALEFSPFAVFLRKIGQKNAASLKRLKFFGATNGHWTNQMAQQTGAGIEVITQLLKYHVPGARQVKICRGPVHWDEFEDGIFESVDDMLEDEVASPPLWDSFAAMRDWYDRYLARQDEEYAMCTTIADMVEKVTWLKRLHVIGLSKGTPACRKTEELEALVKARR